MVKDSVKRAIEKMRAGEKEIDLYDEGLDDEDARAIAEELKGNTSVTKLILDINGIGDEGAKAFAEAIGKNSTLETLRLEDNSIGAEGAKAFAEALGKNSTLKGLNLRANSIGAEGAKAIAEALGKNSTLTELGLQSNSIGAKGARAIAEALGKNSTLETLLLRNNSIGAPGARAIGDALKSNTTLRGLFLNTNSISDPPDATDATCVLAGLLSPNLTRLDVEDNSLTRVPTDAFLAMPESSRFWFHMNCWQFPPQEVFDHNGYEESSTYPAVRDFLAKIRTEGGSRKCGVSKMMLVGLGEAGKTSLLNAIRDEDSGTSREIDRDDRTVGVSLTEWKPSREALDAALAEAGGEMATIEELQVNACDFAGQSEYGVTHQLFLTPRSFYVLVWDASRVVDDGGGGDNGGGDSGADSGGTGTRGLVSSGGYNDLVDRWLDTIQTRAPGAQVLLVATHCGAPEFKDDPAKLERGCRAMAMHVARRTQRMRAASHRAAKAELKEAQEAASSKDAGPARDPRKDGGGDDDAPTDHESREMSRRERLGRLDREGRMAFLRDALSDGAPHVHGTSAAVREVGIARESLEDVPPAVVDSIASAVIRVDSIDGAGIPEARRKILQCVASMPEVGLELPPSWIAVKEHLAELRGGSSGTPTRLYLHLDEAHAAYVSTRSADGGDLRGVGSADDYAEAARFWHRIGEVYVFEDLLFPDPARVFTVVRTIVRHAKDHRKEENLPPREDEELQRDFAVFLDRHVLSRRLLLGHLWRASSELGSRPSNEDARSLIGLLEFFGVLVRRGVEPGADADVWFVPSLVADDGAPAPHARVLDDARGLLVRRFSFPLLPFAFMHRVHSKLKLGGRLDVELGYAWGVLRSRTRGKEQCEAVYRLEGPAVFPPEQFDPGEVGSWHVLHPRDVSNAVTVESNDEALLDVAIKFVREAAAFFAGVRHTMWAETPFPSARDPARRVHVRLDADLEKLLRNQRPHTLDKLPCLPGPFDVAELRSSAPPFAFISYEWGSESQVDALQETMESRLHLRCWRDKERFVEGDRLDRGMVAGIAASRLVIVCLTRAYLKSANCLLEYRAMRDQGKPMVLVVLEDGGLPTAKVLLRDVKDDAWSQYAKDQWDEFHDRSKWPQTEFDALVDLVKTNFLGLKMWGETGALEDMYVDGSWTPDFARRLRDAVDRAVAETVAEAGTGSDDSRAADAPHGTGPLGARPASPDAYVTPRTTPRAAEEQRPPAATDGGTAAAVSEERVRQLEARLAEEKERSKQLLADKDRQYEQRLAEERERSERQLSDKDRQLADKDRLIHELMGKQGGSKSCSVQ